MVGVIIVVSLDLIPEALVGLPSIAIALLAFSLIVLFKRDVAMVAVGAMVREYLLFAVGRALLFTQKTWRQTE